MGRSLTIGHRITKPEITMIRSAHPAGSETVEYTGHFKHSCGGAAGPSNEEEPVALNHGAAGAGKDPEP